jgi:hypothetical protein
MSRKLGSFQNVQYWFHLGHGFGRKLMPKRFSWLKFIFFNFQFLFLFYSIQFFATLFRRQLAEKELLAQSISSRKLKQIKQTNRHTDRQTNDDMSNTFGQTFFCSVSFNTKWVHWVLDVCNIFQVWQTRPYFKIYLNVLHQINILLVMKSNFITQNLLYYFLHRRWITCEKIPFFATPSQTSL